MTDEGIIAEIATRLEYSSHPARIILIGYLSHGTADPDAEMNRGIRCLGLSKDIIVLTCDEYDVGAGFPSGIAHAAHHEGRVLYAA